MGTTTCSDTQDDSLIVRTTYHSIGLQTDDEKNSKQFESKSCQTETDKRNAELRYLTENLKRSQNEEKDYLQLLANQKSIIQAQFNKITDLEQQLKCLQSKTTKEKQKNANRANETPPLVTDSATKSNPFDPSTESKPDILVHGFMRRIEDEFDDFIIPQDITNLCYLFYYQDMNLILLSGSKQNQSKKWNEMQYIKLYHIKKQYTKYFVNIHSVKDNKDATIDANFDRYSYGQCVSSHISLPNWSAVPPQIYAENRKVGKYQCVMRCGGVYARNDVITNSCDMILFDADSKTSDEDNVMNGYHIELPSLPVAVKSPSVLYDESSSTLYCIGGQYHDSRTASQVYTLQLNSGLMDWVHGCGLNEARYASSLCMITDHQQIAVIGGRANDNYNNNYGDNSGFYKRSVELLSIRDKDALIDIHTSSTMNCGRVACGSCYNNVNGNTIIVGGGLGFGASNSVEYLDLNKNKWSLLKYETNHPHHTPFITYDIYNPNIIYIGGNSIGNHVYSMLGFIEWIDIRDSATKCWNFLVDKPMEHIFNLRNDLQSCNAIWRSRSLMLS